MRIKKNGEQFAQDMSIQAHAAAENIPMRWTGSLAQTLDFYGRHAESAARFLRHREFAYCNNHALNVDLLAAAIVALDALAAHVAQVKEAQG